MQLTNKSSTITLLLCRVTISGENCKFALLRNDNYNAHKRAFQERRPRRINDGVLLITVVEKYETAIKNDRYPPPLHYIWYCYVYCFSPPVRACAVLYFSQPGKRGEKRRLVDFYIPTQSRRPTAAVCCPKNNNNVRSLSLLSFGVLKRDAHVNYSNNNAIGSLTIMFYFFLALSLVLLYTHGVFYFLWFLIFNGRFRVLICADDHGKYITFNCILLLS